MNYNSDLEKLYRGFIAEMDQPLASRYYEEDELLDIFDYATDIADDAVRMEVVLMAQRLYPGSTEMAERKAMLYWSMGNDNAATKVIGMIPGKHFMARLTRLRIKFGKNGISADDFSALIKGVKRGTIPDEEIIQLIEAVEDSAQMQWLVDNYDKLKELAQYPETLMYNIVDPILDWNSNDNFEFVNRVLDDLTMASPYDIGYWEFAADIVARCEADPERALGFTEYALAINPKSVKSLVIKAECLLSIDKPDVPAAVKAAMEASMLDPKSASVCMAYAHALYANGQNEEAMQVVKRYLDRPGCELSVIVPVAKIFDSLDIYSLLKSAVANVNPDDREHQLDTVLTKFVEYGKYEYVAQVMELIEELGFQAMYKPEFMVELYFRTNRFERALPYLEKSYPLDNRTWLLALIMSLPHEHKELSLNVIDERIELLDTVIKRGNFAEILEAKAIKAYVAEVRRAVNSGEKFDIAKFSPFNQDTPLRF
ncbi:MAG: hypothetical protein K2O88_07310 [Paramuribaculum sp.]|nr:hypothetical protein [Paramuribaculum sp.]